MLKNPNRLPKRMRGHHTQSGPKFGFTGTAFVFANTIKGDGFIVRDIEQHG
jgi:hypothetical protein